MWQVLVPVSGVLGVVFAMLLAGACFYMGYVGVEQPQLDDGVCEDGDALDDDAPESLGPYDGSCDPDSPAVEYVELTLAFFQDYIVEPWYEVGTVVRERWGGATA